MKRNRESVSTLLIYFIFSLILNSLANSLTIATDMGSAVWTAAAVNLSKLLNQPLGLVLFLFAGGVAILNEILWGEFSLRRFLGSLLFALSFGYLVQWGGYIWQALGINNQINIWLRVVLDIVGLICVGIAISIYQRVNLVMHPNDEFTYVLRFKYFKGNAVVAQWVNYTIPVIVFIISYICMKRVYAIGIGTLWALVTQGAVTGWSDKYIFPKLYHHLDPLTVSQEKDR